MASPFFADFGLMWYLQELKKKEFMRFKELFKQETSQLGLRQIPWAEVKRASREELASLLLEHYEEQQAWDVTFRVFQRMDRQDLCERATRESTGHSKMYQAHVREKFCSILVKEAIPAIHKSYDENIIQDELQYVESLFTPKTPGKVVHTVLLRGKQGSGKTHLLTKLMLAWSRGHLYLDRFFYIFYFCCQELKHLPVTSLAELISSTWPDASAPVSQILAHPEKILFLVDGLEQLGCDLSEPESELCQGWGEARPPRLLLSSLLKRKMVPECCLLITVTMEFGLELEARLADPEVRMLMGFGNRDIQECLYRVFQDLQQATEAFCIIQQNAQILELCRLPVPCWLVSTVLKLEMDRGADMAHACSRSTPLYASFLFHLFTPRMPEGPSWQGQAQLHSLCSLAVQGMWANCMVFGEQDLRRNGIADSDLPALLELRILLRCRGPEPRYKFLHSSIQEFCAALFYLLKSPGHHPHPAVAGTQDLLLTFLDKSRTHWVFLGCFLFGLLHERERQRLDTFFGFQLSNEVKQQLYQCLKVLGQTKDLHKKVHLLALFYCLFEMQDEAFVRQAMALLQELTFPISSRTDLEVSAHCLKHCSNLRQLSLSMKLVLTRGEKGQGSESDSDLLHWYQVCSVLTTNGHLHTLRVKDSTLSEPAFAVLFNQLSQPNCILENLLMTNVNFHCESWRLFEVLMHNPNLKHLNLSNTRLGHEDVKWLRDMLNHPTCHVNKLVLVNCKLKADECRVFASILMDNRKIRYLNLASNHLGKGVRALCKALCHPDSTLNLLGLAFCSLSNWCWDYLAEVLLTNRTLKVLDLSLNIMRDEGLNVLCEALRFPSCSLEVLWLEDCGLTGACCGDLATVLTSSRTLILLNLIDNRLGHHGVVLLCEGLRHPDCNLHLLGLRRTMFRPETQALLLDEEERNPNLIITDDW
ncbi:NACHT, LRR and PYD domains-containing protein 4-like isoform X3 [Cavia porcellus]|uniref:NACHT, LRR and PYD domains-containing protein 4-like isoform X3 n=1 Tax=Cavia porcellus TaxID=10141 RepID=UPI002FE28BC6